MAIDRAARDWDNAELLEHNRLRLLRECRQKMQTYEARYELASGRVDAELRAGRLRDTAEVCDWVITFHTYRALEGEQVGTTGTVGRRKAVSSDRADGTDRGRDPRTLVVWQAPELSCRLMKRRWGDGMPDSYGAQVWTDGGWRWARGDEEHRRVLISVTRWLDAQAREREKSKEERPA